MPYFIKLITIIVAFVGYELATKNSAIIFGDALYQFIKIDILSAAAAMIGLPVQFMMHEKQFNIFLPIFIFLSLCIVVPFFYAANLLVLFGIGLLSLYSIILQNIFVCQNKTSICYIIQFIEGFSKVFIIFLCTIDIINIDTIEIIFFLILIPIVVIFTLLVGHFNVIKIFRSFRKNFDYRNVGITDLYFSLAILFDNVVKPLERNLVFLLLGSEMLGVFFIISQISGKVVDFTNVHQTIIQPKYISGEKNSIFSIFTMKVQIAFSLFLLFLMCILPYLGFFNFLENYVFSVFLITVSWFVLAQDYALVSSVMARKQFLLLLKSKTCFSLILLGLVFTIRPAELSTYACLFLLSAASYIVFLLIFARRQLNV